MSDPGVLFNAIFGQKLIIDPGFEDWDSETDLNQWVETTTGIGASVTRNASTPYRGNYAASLVVPTGASLAQVAQGVTLTSGVTYKLRAIHAGNAPLIYTIQNGSGDYLQGDGTWDIGIEVFSFAANASYDADEKEFTPDETSEHTFVLGNNVGNTTVVLAEAMLYLPGVDRRMGHLDNKMWADQIRHMDSTHDSYLPT